MTDASFLPKEVLLIPRLQSVFRVSPAVILAVFPYVYPAPLRF
jgi:hypothetical protein